MPPRTPLIYPKEYFESRTNYVRPGLGAFLLYAIGSIAFVFLIVRLVIARAEDLPDGTATEAYNLLWESVALLFFGMVIGLLVVAAIMHFLGGWGSREGRFGDSVAVAGWAYIPDLLAAAVIYVLFWFRTRDTTFDGSDPEALAADLDTVEFVGAPEAVVMIAAIAWSVYILAKGTSATHDVELAATLGPALLIGIGALVFWLIGW